MRIPMLLIASLLTLGLAATDADAAKRFGGGSNLGKQRAAPTKDAPAATPAQPAPATPAAAPAAPAPKPSFMSRWGGLLAGLGIGALLASMFGAQMGPIVGMLLAGLLLGGLAFLLYRLFAARGNPAPAAKPMSFAGIGSGVPAAGIPLGGNASPPASSPDASPAATLRPNFDVETFLRGARTTFIRLQAANDAKDLDDIREYTTSEMYAEIAMQIQERGDEPQKTEVMNVNAQLVDVAVEDGYDIASVRFVGLMREQAAGNPEPFDEVWHVRKKIGDKNPAWLIAGIQQTPE